MALKVWGGNGGSERGYVVMWPPATHKSAIGFGKGAYYLVTTRGLTGSKETDIRRATVFDQATANKAANEYHNKGGAAIPDPLGRTPNKIGEDGRRAVDETNYFWNTVATFENLANPGPETEAMWARLKSQGRLDHVSDYGSQYVIVGNTLYRYADHWGSFATVTWNISPRPKALPTRPGSIFTGKMGFAIGRVQFSQMRFK